MPWMIRVYLRSVVIGALLSCCFLVALLALDIAHLRHLITTSSVGWLAAAMLIAFNTIVFAGVQFAWAIMSQAERPSRPGGGSRARTRWRAVPIPVPSGDRRRR